MSVNREGRESSKQKEQCVQRPVGGKLFGEHNCFPGELQVKLWFSFLRLLSTILSHHK